jgi:hypothetical protein
MRNVTANAATTIFVLAQQNGEPPLAAQHPGRVTHRIHHDGG